MVQGSENCPIIREINKSLRYRKTNFAEIKQIEKYDIARNNLILTIKHDNMSMQRTPLLTPLYTEKNVVLVFFPFGVLDGRYKVIV